jgi:hypothetical protein
MTTRYLTVGNVVSIAACMHSMSMQSILAGSFPSQLRCCFSEQISNASLSKVIYTQYHRQVRFASKKYDIRHSSRSRSQCSITDVDVLYARPPWQHDARNAMHAYVQTTHLLAPRKQDAVIRPTQLSIVDVVVRGSFDSTAQPLSSKRVMLAPGADQKDRCQTRAPMKMTRGKKLWGKRHLRMQINVACVFWVARYRCIVMSFPVKVIPSQGRGKKRSKEGRFKTGPSNVVQLNSIE